MEDKIQDEILDLIAESVADLYQKLTSERQNRLDIHGEKRYLDNIHLTLAKITNNISELRDITILEEIR